MSASPFTSQFKTQSPSSQPLPAASVSALTIADAGWFGDPLNRFEGRFFDGDEWTNQISDKGILRLDPDWLTASAIKEGTLSNLRPEFAGTERRGSHDRRQINIMVDVDRRQGNRRDR